MFDKPLVVFLVGPTASGKSEIAVKLAGLMNAEIISADSMQVYRGMDILSAKPSEKELQAVTHHLISIIPPEEEYNAAIFRVKAEKTIEEIIKKNKIPVVIGGTGLYVDALIKGLFDDKGKDQQLRNKLYAEAQKKGNSFLYEKLKEIDPQAAEKIHPNNIRRVIRALEVCELNDAVFSRLKAKREGLDKFYNLKIFGIERKREQLYRRIEARVDAMFKAGLVEEVKVLSKKNLSQTARQALGLKQIKAYLEGECSLEQAKETLKRDTRRFAKRQMTWFKKDKNIVWLEGSDNDVVSAICAKIREIIPTNIK